MDKRVIVISAINLRSGGGLTILRDCLNYLSSSQLNKEYRIVALVHKKELADYPDIEYKEFPDSVSSWLKRVYYEYIGFKGLSKRLNPVLWLSLHDITPNVQAERRAVYMHNPMISYKLKRSDLNYDFTYILFALFYRFLYSINLKKNQYCIVQQEWFRKVVEEKLHIPQSKIIVARPNIEIRSKIGTQILRPCRYFFYPSLPRPFKNFETVCEATSILYNDGIEDIRVRLTMDGTESAYAKSIVEKYSSVPVIEFCGLLSKDQMDETYRESDCLIFPSRLETWGLPISEFIPMNKAMIVADLPYAHETAQGGQIVRFFDTISAQDLASSMKKAYDGDFSDFRTVPNTVIAPPYAPSYKELFEILLDK